MEYTFNDYKKGQPRWCPGCGDHFFLASLHKAMAETGAHDRGDQQGVQQRVEKTFGDSFTLEEPFEYVPSEDESGDEQERIPPDPQASDMEYDGVHVPVDRQNL